MSIDRRSPKAPPARHLVHRTLGFALAWLALFGCAAPPVLRGAAVNFGDQHVAGTPLAGRLAFTVRQKLAENALGPGANGARAQAGYGLAYLQEVDWDTAVITLTNAAPVVNLTSGPLTATIVAGVRSASYVFNPITPATNYTVTITLKRAGTPIASGTTTGLTLIPGPNLANVPVAINNQNVVTIDHVFVTPDTTTANVQTFGYATIGSLAVPKLNGSITGDTALGNYQEVSGIDIDTTGNVYISDAKEGRIVMVPPTGAVPTLIVGTAGTPGYSPDGPITGATMANVPRGLVHEATTAGRLFFCEYGTGASDGRIRTIIGGNLSTYGGGGLGVAGGSGVDALSLQLNKPSGLCSDAAGNLFFTEVGLGLLRRIATGTRTLSTLDTPGGTNLENFGPCCLDATNNLLYYSVGNTIYSLTTPAATPGARTTVVTLTTAQLGALVSASVTVTGLSVDGNGLLYAAVASTKNAALDSDVHVVRIPVDSTGALVLTAGRSIDVIAGNGATLSGTSNDLLGRVIDGTTQNLGGSKNNLAIDIHSSNGATQSGTLVFGNTFASGTPFAEVLQLFPPANVSAHYGTLMTVAGTGILGTSGDGGAATTAQFSRPVAVAFDATGNLYVADRSNNNVRKVTPTGIISTYAGTGTGGAAGDGGAATSAQLFQPYGVALDAAGNLYIADEFNNKVRKVTPGGIISTFAGTGTAGATGDGGAATSAKLSNPYALAVDALGNVYIADTSNQKIRKVAPGGIISTYAGTGTAGATGDGGAATAALLTTPNGLALDAAGNLYIADNGNNKIRKVTPAGIISSFAGTGTAGVTGDGGAATAALLNSPTGVTVDAAGNVYIADRLNHEIRRVTPDGIIGTFAGNGTTGSLGDGGAAAVGQLNFPGGLAVDATGSLVIADEFNSKIRKVF